MLSPEKTVLTYRVAGLGTRMLAQVIDLVIMTGFSYFLYMLLLVVATATNFELMMVLASVLSGFSFFLYFILFETLWNGATPGKKAMGVRVRMADGTPASFTAVLARNLLRVADFLPFGYFAGLLAVCTNPRSQRLGDLVAGTIVVEERKNVRGFRPSPHSFGVHPFEASVGELRGMTLEEYAALKRLCDRYPELPSGIQDPSRRCAASPTFRESTPSTSPKPP